MGILLQESSLVLSYPTHLHHSQWLLLLVSTASTSPRRTSSGSSRRPPLTASVMPTLSCTTLFSRCSLMPTPTTMDSSAANPSPNLWTRQLPFPELTDTLHQIPSSTRLRRREIWPGRRRSTPWI